MNAIDLKILQLGCFKLLQIAKIVFRPINNAALNNNSVPILTRRWKQSCMLSLRLWIKYRFKYIYNQIHCNTVIIYYIWYLYSVYVGYVYWVLWIFIYIKFILDICMEFIRYMEYLWTVHMGYLHGVYVGYLCRKFMQYL